ncbi:MAG: hypothetical protein AAF707_00755 [Pseudomonadota bacterium]
MLRVVAISVCLLATSCQESSSDSCDQTNVYRLDSKGGRIFFDLDAGRTGSVGNSSLEIESHFSGTIENCSTEYLVCIYGGEFPIFYPVLRESQNLKIWKLICSMTVNNSLDTIICRDEDGIAQGSYFWEDRKLLRLELREFDKSITEFRSSGCPISFDAISEWLRINREI